MTAPIIPGLNDHEMEAMLEASRAAGAVTADYVLLRMPLEIKGLFREWLAEAVPDRAARVISLLRQMHGGKDYDPEWRARGRGDGPLAALLKARFAKTCARLGFQKTRTPLRTDLFRKPALKDDPRQLGLFDSGAAP